MTKPERTAEMDLRDEEFEEGYIEGKEIAKADLKLRTVNITDIKKFRNIEIPYVLGFEIGYLRQLLWTLTEGKIK